MAIAMPRDPEFGGSLLIGDVEMASSDGIGTVSSPPPPPTYALPIQLVESESTNDPATREPIVSLRPNGEMPSIISAQEPALGGDGYIRPDPGLYDIVAAPLDTFKPTPHEPLPTADVHEAPTSSIDPIALMPPAVSIPVAVAQTLSPAGGSQPAADAAPFTTGKVASSTDGLTSNAMIIIAVLVMVLLLGGD